MARWSEANYLSRRVKLTEHITAATAAWKDAAFRLEIGEASEEAVRAAKQAIDDLEARLEGLDAAWERSVAEMNAERAEAGRIARKEAMAAVEKHLAARKKAAGQMDKLATDLGRAYEAYRAADRAIMGEIAPFNADLGRDGVQHLRDELGLSGSRFHDVEPLIGTALAEAGLMMSGTHFTPLAFVQRESHKHGISHFATMANDMIRDRLAPIASAAEAS